MNFFPLNGQTLNFGPIPYAILSVNGVVNFGGYDLSECGRLYIREQNFDDLGEVDLDTENLPLQDGGLVFSYLTRRKVLDLVLVVNEPTIDDLNNTLDQLKKYLGKQEQNLDILVNGQIRRTKASLTGFKVNRDLAKESVQQNIDVQLTSVSPHFWLKDPITTTGFGVVLPNISLDFTNLGSARSNYNVVFTFDPGNTGITQITLGHNGVNMTITNTFNDGDILQIDGVKKRVYKNGTSIRYTGIFQELELDTNIVTVLMNGSARNYSVSTSFLQQYK